MPLRSGVGQVSSEARGSAGSLGTLSFHSSCTYLVRPEVRSVRSRSASLSMSEPTPSRLILISGLF